MSKEIQEFVDRLTEEQKQRLKEYVTMEGEEIHG